MGMGSQEWFAELVAYETGLEPDRPSVDIATTTRHTDEREEQDGGHSGRVIRIGVDEMDSAKLKNVTDKDTVSIVIMLDGDQREYRYRRVFKRLSRALQHHKTRFELVVDEDTTDLDMGLFGRVQSIKVLCRTRWVCPLAVLAQVTRRCDKSQVQVVELHGNKNSMVDPFTTDVVVRLVGEQFHACRKLVINTVFTVGRRGWHGCPIQDLTLVDFDTSMEDGDGAVTDLAQVAKLTIVTGTGALLPHLRLSNVQQLVVQTTTAGAPLNRAHFDGLESLRARPTLLAAHGLCAADTSALIEAMHPQSVVLRGAVDSANYLETIAGSGAFAHVHTVLVQWHGDRNEPLLGENLRYLCLRKGLGGGQAYYVDCEWSTFVKRYLQYMTKVSEPWHDQFCTYTQSQNTYKVINEK